MFCLFLGCPPGTRTKWSHAGRGRSGLAIHHVQKNMVLVHEEVSNKWTSMVQWQALYSKDQDCASHPWSMFKADILLCRILCVQNSCPSKIISMFSGSATAPEEVDSDTSFFKRNMKVKASAASVSNIFLKRELDYISEYIQWDYVLWAFQWQLSWGQSVRDRTHDFRLLSADSVSRKPLCLSAVRSGTSYNVKIEAMNPNVQTFGIWFVNIRLGQRNWWIPKPC